MRRAFPLLVSFVVLGAAAAPAGAASVPAGPRAEVPSDSPGYAPDRVIVRFRPGAKRSDARDEIDATSSRRLDLTRTELVRLPRGRSVAAAVRRLRARGDVELAQPDFSYRPEGIPNDPLFGQEWGLHNTGQIINGSAGTADADIDAPEAWDVTTGSDSLLVGVIDTGVNITHPDLQPNIFVNAAEANGTPGDDDDGNGAIDDVSGFDFFNDNATVSDDAAGHGTAVASILGGRGGNALGATGVTQRARILPMQVVDSTGGLPTSAIVDAVAYARQMGARVVNMSFGHYDPSEDTALVQAIDDSPGILFSTSAGNLNSANQPNDNDVSPHWPSNLTIDHANVIASANTTNTDTLSSGSSYGGTSVDLAAPGTAIVGASAAQKVFDEDFDGVAAGTLPTGWTRTGDWNTTSEGSPTYPAPPSSPNSLTDSPGGPYAENTDTAATSPAFTIPTTSTCTVNHLRYRRTESGSDFLHVAVSKNGGAFNDIQTAVSGSSPGSGYVSSAPTFAATAGDSARVRFELVTDASAGSPNDGVHIDDVNVTCTPGADGYVSGTGTSFSSPTTAGAAALLLARDPSLTPGQLKATLRATVDPIAGLDVSTGGRLNVDRAIRSLATAPAVATAAATGVGTTTATVNGSVNPDGDSTDFHFEYRRVGDASFASTPDTGAGSGLSTAPASASLSGLDPETAYEFRVVATNPKGTTTGSTVTFTSGTGSQPVPRARDTRAPRVSALVVAPSAFLPLRAGATIARTRRGATVRFRVDEASTVRVRVLARRPGRRAGSKCVKPARANRRARACFRYVSVGTTAVKGKVTGRVSRRFSGRVGGRALAPGTYRLEVVATDAARNRSRPATASFRIARR